MTFKKQLLFSALMLISLFALAEKPRTKGYYVNSAGDTVKTMLEVSVNLFNKSKVEESGFFWGITIIEKGKEVKLTDNEMQAFGFMYLGQRYEFRFIKEVSMQAIGHMNSQGLFLRLLVKGDCELYLTSTLDGTSHDYYFKRSSGDTYLTKNTGSLLSHDKDLISFFNDCPMVGEKIKTKSFKGDDKYKQIAIFYNANCATEAPANQEE